MRSFFSSITLATLACTTLLTACGGNGGKVESGSGAGSGSGGEGGTGGGTGGAGGSGGAGGGGSAPMGCEPPNELADVSSPTTVVGTGTPASCTEAALDAAITSGGVIVFDCGPDPVTIVLSKAKTIQADTVVDGGGRVTLSGDQKTRIFEMDTKNFEATSPTLTVQRLTLRDGKASGTAIPLGTDVDGGGGAIYHVGGNVSVVDCVFLDNEAALEGPDVAGGAIYSIGRGTLRVTSSRFSGNRASNGGALGALGAAILIADSTLEENRATGYGANSVEPNGQQVGRGGNGGAICMDGQGRTLSICGTLVQNNQGRAYGGALFRTGYETEPTIIDRSTFDGNSIVDQNDAPGMPSSAGGLYIQGTHVTMTASTVSNNQSEAVAGLWILGHGATPAIADLTNVTLTGNTTYPRADFTTRGIGGGLYIGDKTSGKLTNCTIVGNAAQFASGIANVSNLELHNTILHNDAENPYTPLNCTGSAYAQPPGTGTNNLQWPIGIKDDMDCTPGISRVDPLLGDLADNGGPTRTIAPQAASPAIGAGTDCPPTDQRGNPRNPAQCTLGAYEP
ncbi:choice-of-anchor Q domain-containing protein [Polyangium sorediatum]|uniref:Choice-of-anchor Q domain-containing protein n=1 Tax=Polyangium sorediatum TaxID=889274 RepID=A0ABT6NW57_9BACT|nr:choice-of-anchor Q domain-containing protein [Polyangium sorediatum]MDI1432529.1 choice-of-anchor Q domain-containing protein [Polyangium sorediatum]